MSVLAAWEVVRQVVAMVLGGPKRPLGLHGVQWCPAQPLRLGAWLPVQRTIPLESACDTTADGDGHIEGLTEQLKLGGPESAAEDSRLLATPEA